MLILREGKGTLQVIDADKNVTEKEFAVSFHRSMVITSPGTLQAEVGVPFHDSPRDPAYLAGIGNISSPGRYIRYSDRGNRGKNLSFHPGRNGWKGRRSPQNAVSESL
jgi:hypothetical protein